MKRVFSFAPDGVLKPIRNILRNNSNNGFPINEIFAYFKGTNRALHFTDDDVSNLLEAKYGQRDTLVILSILNPWADLRNNFHIDHMFPQTIFKRNKVREYGVSKNEIDVFIENYNYLGNLQLLEQIPNIEKNGMELNDWISKTVPTSELNDYMKKHYIPNVSLAVSNFNEFIKERENLLIEKLKLELKP